MTESKATDDVSEMFTAENKSLVKQFLTQEMYDKYKGVKAKDSGFSFKDTFNSVLENQDSSVGAYGGCEDCYTSFKDLFDPIIDAYHNYPAEGKHTSDMDPSHLKMPAEDPGYSDYVNSTRIRVGRNIRGFGLSPGITTEDRDKVEKLVTTALGAQTGEHKGTYYPLTGMSEEDRIKLVEDHFLFKKGDRFLEACGANRDWPRARGIFHNDAKTFLVWVNEEDQMRIISMEAGGDFVGIFARLVAGIAAIEKTLIEDGQQFAFNDHHGFIHSCPTNLGTGMRASVHMKLPKLSQQADFHAQCKAMKLQARGIHGEHSESVGGVYDISNMERIGSTEVELVQTLIDGVTSLILKEKALE